jgi:hypothetical protein
MRHVALSLDDLVRDPIVFVGSISAVEMLEGAAISEFQQLQNSLPSGVDSYPVRASSSDRNTKTRTRRLKHRMGR